MNVSRQGINPSPSQGVIVAANAAYESFLPWWWKHYQAYASLPVTFFDLGMTDQGKAFCQSKGNWTLFTHSMDFVAPRERVSPKHRAYWEKHWTQAIWEKRKAWFAKPLILLQSPYTQTLFLDLDCKIQGDITPLFDFLSPSVGFTIVKHVFREGFYHNSGVCLASTGSPVVLKWAEECLQNSHRYMGDEDVIHHLILENYFEIPFFPLKYNHPHPFGGGDQAVIQHFLGLEGKKKILLDS